MRRDLLPEIACDFHGTCDFGRAPEKTAGSTILADLLQNKTKKKLTGKQRRGWEALQS